MEPSFELCALSFLVQWLENERELHQCLKAKPTPHDVHRALRYFQVARSFEGIRDDATVRVRIRTLFDAVRRNSRLSPVDKVVVLADKFKDEFGLRNLSAASKLMWLSSRTPFIVYDKRAVDALNVRWKDRTDYSAYCAAWRCAYSVHRLRIAAATARLRGTRPLARACGVSDKQLVALSKAEWFRERVFDKYLWLVGGDDTDER